MGIIIKAKNVKLDPKLEKFINSHIGSLGKFLPPNSTGLIEVNFGLITKHHQKGDIYSAEILIDEPRGKALRAYSEKESIEIAVQDAKKEIEVQLTKFKDKLVTERKRTNEKAV